MQASREWVCRVRLACATKCALKSVSHIVGVRLLLSTLRVAFSAFLLGTPSGVRRPESWVLSPVAVAFVRAIKLAANTSQHLGSASVKLAMHIHKWMRNPKKGLINYHCDVKWSLAELHSVWQLKVSIISNLMKCLNYRVDVYYILVSSVAIDKQETAWILNFHSKCITFYAYLRYTL